MLFLLGGYDLEMTTIRELLLEQGYQEIAVPRGADEPCFADKRLSWGARLSLYAVFFSHPSAIYGIELTQDVPPPVHYQTIDHHNEYTGRPSSLEQVATLLGVALTRQQQLVAANDKGFIPALEAMGATAAEISDIRSKDRQAQGVTIEDEQLAMESIERSLCWEQGIAIVHALTPKFSPITDRMYGKAVRLLVYTDKKLVYYGPGASKLAAHYNGLIREHKAYTGGGSNGYFGVVEGVFGVEEIESKLISDIKKMTGE